VSRVLVSGGSGFIGLPTLVGLRRAGIEVHALSSRPAPPAVDGVRWWQVDLADRGAVERATCEIAADSLMHLAWYVEHGRFWSAQENVEWVERSLHLLRSFAGAGGQRVVMVGTCAEYDWSVTAPRLGESSSPIAPATLYGAAKDGLRRVAAAFADQAQVEFAWGRLFFLYGPREAPNRLVAAVIRGALAGRPVDVTSGRQIRDLLHVEDVAGALVALLGSGVTGAVNIGSGEAVALADVFDHVGRLCGHPELIRRGALEDRPGEPDRLVAEVDRLHGEVGFSARWSLADGLADAMRWWESESRAAVGQAALRLDVGSSPAPRRRITRS
jgi:nucleoside-diphosphate-sugar epimerase